MRKLTFEGFLKQYVAELSGIQTVSVHKLADCMTENCPHRAVQRAYPVPGHGRSERPAPAACGARCFLLPLPSVRSWP